MSAELTPDNPSKDNALVQLRNIEKYYNKKRVLTIDSMNLCYNDFIALRGENGAGKSTLLKILAGISIPNAGKRQISPQYNKLNSAYIPQSGGLLRHLSVVENMEVQCNMNNCSFNESLFDKWYIKDLGLSTHLSKSVKNLSGGFQKIAAIACVFATNPDGLFIDEPFSGLDINKARMIAIKLSEFASKHAFVVITHHQDLEPISFTKSISLANGYKI